MKCNKCGTPIIPGESTCRICGNKTDFSKRVKQPEVIDFPEEIEKKVEQKEEIIDLPDFGDIIDVPVSEKVEEEIQLPEPALDESIVNEESTSPAEQEVIEVAKDVEKDTIDVIEEQRKETKKANKKKNLDKTLEKELKPKKTVPLKKHKKSSNNFGTIILIIILIVSLVLNAYLIVNGSNNINPSDDDSTKTNKTYSKVVYENYKLNVSSNWITENSNNGLLIYDDTQNWAASMILVDDANYAALSTNKESLGESLRDLRYQFTSNYSKSVNDKEFHLFKGKYYDDYSVFVIVTELDEDTLIVVDLKFKGEVDDILLNNILVMMTDVRKNNAEELFKNNFEFVDIKEQIKSVSEKLETTEE